MFIHIFGVTLGINIWVLVILLIATIILLRANKGIAFTQIAGAYVTFQAIGVMSLSIKTQNFQSLYVIVGGIVLYSLGVYTFRYHRNSNRINNQSKAARFPDRDVMLHIIVFTFLSLATIYHFRAGGLTLFSESLDIDRFNTTRSGLFGIPTRLVQYSFPIFALYTTTYIHRVINKKSYFTFAYVLVWLSLIIISILLGYKGAIINVIVLYLIVDYYHNSRKLFLNPLKSINKYILVAASVALGLFAAYLISANYSTINQSLDYMVLRVTEIGGRPFKYVVDQYTFTNGISAKYILNDIRYILSLFGLTSGSPGTTIKQISAVMWGRSLSGFVPPITITAFGQFYLLSGIYGTYLLSFIFGYFCGWLTYRYFLAQGILSKTTVLTFQWIFVTFMITGNLIYLLFNILAGYAFFIIFLRTASIIITLLNPLKSKKQRLQTKNESIHGRSATTR